MASPMAFGALLKHLRTQAGLTQEELAEAARLSARSISDLERGINSTARRDTARLLADALRLTGAARSQFESAARGRPPNGPSAAPGTFVTTRTLPRDIASFTGRETELDHLAAAVTRSASGGVIGIHAIGGMAGIGKTAFAVHAAHRLASQFPAGQIFLTLHGHTPGRAPVEPADALTSLLQTDGVPASQIPPGLEDRIALWRDRLAGQRWLLVFDDAANTDQVGPLLPGASGCLVLITSRRHLSALEDSSTISLDTLPPEQAARLLVLLAAQPGLQQDDTAVAELTRLCGYLPLAVGMLARQLHHHPAWTAADLAADLITTRDRLELMAAENLSVAAAFDLSYRDLAPDQQRIFRLLALHPGTDIDAFAAAALADISVSVARRHLEGLYNHYLLAEPARGRYRMHDLIREHARTLAARDDPVSDQDQAIGRILDYYQCAAVAASRYITRYTRPGRPPESTAIAVPDLGDGERALSWARAERANLTACLDLAAHTAQHGRVVALTAGMAALLQHDGPWSDAITRHTAAVGAARLIDDRNGEAASLTDLAVIRWLTDDVQRATKALEAALAIYTDIGEPLGQGNSHYHLGATRRHTGEYPGATVALHAALALYRDVGDQLGQANALNEIGGVHYQVGSYPEAAAAHQEALKIYRDIGDLVGQANTHRFTGYIMRMTGDFHGAIHAMEAALAVSRDLGDRRGQTSALNVLGIVRQMIGDYPEAARVLEEALAISRDLGDRQGEANALDNLGVVWRTAGDYQPAAEALAEALLIYRDIGDRGGEVEALNEIGTLHRMRGELDPAVACHQQALDLARELTSAWDEAHALAGLARCALADGHIEEARAGLRHASEIFQRIGAGETAEIFGELQAFPGGEERA